MTDLGPALLVLGISAGFGAAILATLAPRRAQMAATLLAVSTASVVAATLILARAFWSADFSLAYVADHTRRDLDPLARVSGLWGGMDGSLLLYAAGLAVAGTVAARRAAPVHRSAIVGVTGAVVALMVLMVRVWADPFRRLEIPAIDGAGLTPILEHPAMSYHPPLLYAGLTSLLAPFALTVAALAQRQLDPAWRRQLRRWLLVSWTLLAAGMLAGAHWAYVELGWGGYWAWDPVENTALLPWLAVTAALHGMLRVDGARPR